LFRRCFGFGRAVSVGSDGLDAYRSFALYTPRAADWGLALSHQGLSDKQSEYRATVIAATVCAAAMLTKPLAKC
jgi:hypothetical protein